MNAFRLANSSAFLAGHGLSVLRASSVTVPVAVVFFCCAGFTPYGLNAYGPYSFVLNMTPCLFGFANLQQQDIHEILKATICVRFRDTYLDI